MNYIFPSDIRNVGEDYLLLGPLDADDDCDGPDVDNIFGRKVLSEIVDDCTKYGGYLEGFLEKENCTCPITSSIRHDLTFVTSDAGTLLFDSMNVLIGGFIESELNLDAAYRGMGLGAEIVVEHFLRNGSLPTWYLDEPAYSKAGYRAVLSASNYPNMFKGDYLRKLANHICVSNSISDQGVIDVLIEALEDLPLELLEDKISSVLDNYHNPSIGM